MQRLMLGVTMLMAVLCAPVDGVPEVKELKTGVVKSLYAVPRKPVDECVTARFELVVRVPGAENETTFGVTPFATDGQCGFYLDLRRVLTFPPGDSEVAIRAVTHEGVVGPSRSYIFRVPVPPPPPVKPPEYLIEEIIEE